MAGTMDFLAAAGQSPQGPDAVREQGARGARAQGGGVAAAGFRAPPLPGARGQRRRGERQ